jgi:hypothetical protein
MKTSIEELTKLWKEIVFDNSNTIDEDNEQDWYSLALGFALGKGENPDDSHKFARHIRYNTDYG